MDKYGKRTLSSRVVQNNSLKYLNQSKESKENKQSKANLFVRNLQLKYPSKLVPNIPALNGDREKRTNNIEKFKSIIPNFEVYQNPSANLQNFLISRSTNKEVSSNLVSFNTNKKESFTQNQFFKRNPFKNLVECSRESKMMKPNLHKKEFSSYKLKNNSKNNLKIPIIQHNRPVPQENVNKYNMKTEGQFKKKSQIDYSFDHSIIEGGKDFSIVSNFSDISLGDHETSSSIKSSSLKIEKIKNQLRNTKEVFNLIKFMD